MTKPALIIAAHGTRDPAGVAVCEQLVARVASMLPETTVRVGYVELAQPGIAEAIQDGLDHVPDQQDEVAGVVVPLMLHTGGHVQSDIPEAIEAGRAGRRVRYAHPLLPDVRMRYALHRRIKAELQDWRAKDVALIVVGRGALVADANAEHYRLSRLLWEELEVALALPAFIQVTRPSVPEALTMAAATGVNKIIISPNFLFPGKLRTWLAEQVEPWCVAHPEIEVKIADVIGDCDELAAVVVDRYREQIDECGHGEGAPVYLSGLKLAGKNVLVVGAGHVAERRIAKLLDSGAIVRVIAPNAGIKVSRMAARGEVEWVQRGFQEDDLDGVWFVQALTNDPSVNAKVAQAAATQRIFCVRADKADAGSAYTPATETAGGLTVGVVGDRDPRRSVRVRDELLRALLG